MTRRLVSWAAILCVLGLGVPLAAQDGGDIAIVNRITPKAGMADQYEEGLKKHNPFHAKHSDSREWLTWEVVGGAGTGEYIRASFGFKWEDFDKESVPSADMDQADEAQTIGPYVESTQTQWLRLMPSHSRLSDRESPTPFTILWTERVIAGKEATYLNAIKKIPEALEKAGSPFRYSIYTIALGGDHPTVYWAVGREKWADMAEPDKSFRTVLEEAYGETEADAILDTLMSSIQSESSEILVYRSDLSYVPATTSSSQ